MWQCSYAKEPFDLRLFVLQSIRRWKWLLLGMVAGTLLIGGGYYLSKVTFCGRLPYEVISKFYIEYAVDPEEKEPFSYFTAYAWDDWMKSDLVVPAMLEKLSVEMSAEEFITYYAASMPADLRMTYFTVTHPDQALAMEISDILTEGMIAFGPEQKEVASVELIDTVGPQVQYRDIRVFRALVLGGVIGFFVSLFTMAFVGILDEKIYVPETFMYRYDIPVLGYVDEEGEVSPEVEANLALLFGNMHEIGEINALDAEGLSASAETLRAMDGNLLLVPAGDVTGKSLEFLLNQCRLQGIKITAALLVDADSALIRQYRFGRT
ncbi:MAG: hypothetical protein IJZ82_07025 [Lachnospiraceae bacterium]|nr:hypothetical protein [Lachnospiraceae bacterium]